MAHPESRQPSFRRAAGGCPGRNKSVSVDAEMKQLEEARGKLDGLRTQVGNVKGARLAEKKPSPDEDNPNPYRSPKTEAVLKQDSLVRELIERVKKGAYVAIDRDILSQEVYNIQ